MTFDPNVPNAGQSPGLFPTQNNTNFARLQTIINTDHVFNDTAQSTDGYHRQCTMIDRAQPMSLPTGSNGIVYTWLDSNSQSQLRFYNGMNDFQITPLGQSPTKITGSVALAAGATSGTIWTIPANTFAYVFVNYIVPAANVYTLYFVFCSGGALVGGDVLKQSTIAGRPTITFSGNDMKIVNGSTIATTTGYYIILESI